MHPEPFGKYQLVHMLAAGGMGEVMLARESGPGGFGRFVAIKRLLSHLVQNEHFIEMFLDEARLAARFNHPNICPIYEFGCLDGRYYLAMEYLQGESMNGVLKSLKLRGAEHRLPPHLGAYIAAAACDGLHYAHERADDEGKPLNLVHRDISPSNLFVTFEGGVKVLDFGIAKASHRIAQTATGSIKGKFPYIAPEIYNSHEPDRRADVFALGCVLWEFLAGKSLFQRDSEYATCRAVVESPTPDPRELVSTVPEPLALIALKATAKVPNERYQSALDMRRALVAYLRTLSEEVEASTLASFMGELFRDLVDKRASVLERLRVTEHEVSGTSALEPTRGEGSKSANRKAAVSQSNSEIATRSLVGVPPDPRRSNRRGLKVGAAAAAITVTAGGLLLYALTRPVPAPPPPAAAPTALAPAPAPAPAPEPPAPAVATPSPPPAEAPVRPEPPKPRPPPKRDKGAQGPAAVNPDEPINPWDKP